MISDIPCKKLQTEQVEIIAIRGSLIEQHGIKQPKQIYATGPDKCV